MSTEFWQLLIWLIFLSICVFIYYSGLLTDVHVFVGRPPIQKNMTIMYKYNTGPYKNAGRVFKDIAKLVPKGSKCIGIYYDDPKTTPEEDLRWALGVITKVDGDASFDEQIITKLTNAQFQQHNLPAVQDAVITRFPNTTFLSIFIAVMRVYPRLSEYIKETQVLAHPAVELYLDDIIHFYFPLEKHNQFYVKEAGKKKYHELGEQKKNE